MYPNADSLIEYPLYVIDVDCRYIVVMTKRTCTTRAVIDIHRFNSSPTHSLAHTTLVRPSRHARHVDEFEYKRTCTTMASRIKSTTPGIINTEFNILGRPDPTSGLRRYIQGAPIKKLSVRKKSILATVARFSVKLLDYVLDYSWNITCKFYWNNYYSSRYTAV